MVKKVILILALCLMMVGCKSTIYVPTEKIVHDSIYITHTRIDSIKEIDSVFVNQYLKGDTIFLEKTKYVYRYKDKLRIDTIIESHTDSITNTIEVEKKLTKWQAFKQDIGEIAIGLTFILIVLLIIKKMNSRGITKQPKNQ